jgi:hypothetical protein
VGERGKTEVWGKGKKGGKTDNLIMDGKEEETKKD